MGREKQKNNRTIFPPFILKYGVSEKPAPRNQDKLESIVNQHMTMLKNNSERVKKYFKHPEIKFAA